MERRDGSRLCPKDTTFVALRPEFNKLGRLLDINRQGLCFRYLSRESTLESAASLSIDMFVSDNGYYLPNIPCKLVYDKKVKQRQRQVFDIGLEYRRCGLKFVQLTRQQSDQIDLYLSEHTRHTH